MKRHMLIAGMAGLLAAFLPARHAAAFFDGFDGGAVSPLKWHIPTWVSPSDGTFLGRTQMRVTQNAPLPAIANGTVLIRLDTFNPTGFSLYGTDLISNKLFRRGRGLVVRVRAKMGRSTPGLVGGIFLYALKPGSDTLHDEIDFELLSNAPGKVNTNIYGNEPLGAGRPLAVPLATGSVNTYHTYEIRWLADKVVWLVDGTVVRKVRSRLPAGPMRLHLNLWAPAADWAEAYSAGLQPVGNAARNQSYAMRVNWVSVQPASPSLSDAE